MGRHLDRRVVLDAVFLSLPTAVVVLLAVWFVSARLPDIERGERAAADEACERAAEELLENPASADFTWRRGEGIVSGASEDRSLAAEFPADLSWKDWGGAGRQRRREMWGWRRRPEGRIVWVRDSVSGRDDRVVYGRLTDIAERNWRGVIYCYGGFSLFVLVGLTIYSVHSLVSSVADREEFMGAAAHDLSTPLVALRFMIGRDDEEARRLNERLIRLVENIKDFLRLGGRRKPKMETFDLKSAYADAYALFREDYRDAFDGEDVPVDSDGQAYPVRADEMLTVQILWNLLGNDLKYAAPFGRVSVAFRRDGARTIVDVADTGRGMTRREMARAFDRYYRAKTIRETGKGGFGIGLSTAREFARAMGGSLSVRANEPSGCVFTLALPSAV